MAYSVLENKTLGNKNKCFYCGIEGFKMSKDHFFPKSKGGRLMVYSCHNCNSIKADKTPIQWVHWIEHSNHPQRKRMLVSSITLGLKCINNGYPVLNKGFEDLLNTL